MPLVEKLKAQLGGQLTSGDLTAENLKTALESGQIPDKIKDLAAAIDTGNFSSLPSVKKEGQKKVTVTITGGTGSETSKARVFVKKDDKSVEEVFKVQKARGKTEAAKIASALALAMVQENVKTAVTGYNLRVIEESSVTITVQNDNSVAQAKRIAYNLGSALTKVSEVTKQTNGTNITVLLSELNDIKTHAELLKGSVGGHTKLFGLDNSLRDVKTQAM